MNYTQEAARITRRWQTATDCDEREDSMALMLSLVAELITGLNGRKVTSADILSLADKLDDDLMMEKWLAETDPMFVHGVSDYMRKKEG